MLVSGGSIYVGSSAITEVYQGNDLVWSNGIPAPAWPGNYFYPNPPSDIDPNGLSLWKSSMVSGQTYTIDLNRDDDEGEGGGGYYSIEPKEGSGQREGGKSNFPTSIIPNKNYANAWVHFYDGWDITFNSLGSFDGGTAVAFRSRNTYGGNGCHIASTGINWNNIELAVNLNGADWYHNDRFDDLIKKCPNLKYISLYSGGTNTGTTITLTGSTAWTAESMKFTEWYCPGTTFIIENNSWWKSRIDWDIAELRNITFKDGNGNIITR